MSKTMTEATQARIPVQLLIGENMKTTPAMTATPLTIITNALFHELTGVEGAAY